MKPCVCNQFLFLKKDPFQNMDFLRLKCQLLKVKIIDTAYLERFSNFQRTRQWVNKVNLWSCQLKNYFKLVLVLLVYEKQNILMSQPCLHTLMQTRLSANHSAGTILVIV